MQAVIRSKFHHLQREKRPASFNHKSHKKIIAVFTVEFAGALALNNFPRGLSEWIGASMKALGNELSCSMPLPCTVPSTNNHFDEGNLGEKQNEMNN